MLSKLIVTELILLLFFAIPKYIDIFEKYCK